MFCRKCGAQIPDDSVFCGKCGDRIERYVENKAVVATTVQEPAQQEFVCPTCGGRVTMENGWYICHRNCGYKYPYAQPQTNNNFSRQVQKNNTVNFECMVGTIIKDRLKITDAGVEWKGEFILAKDIIRIDFINIEKNIALYHSNFFTAQKLGSFKAGKECSLKFSTLNSNYKINLPSQHASEAIDSIWKIAGVRLVNEYIIRAARGEQIELTSMDWISNEGLIVKTKPLLLSTRITYIDWNEFRRSGSVEFDGINLTIHANSESLIIMTNLFNKNLPVVYTILNIVKAYNITYLSELL